MGKGKLILVIMGGTSATNASLTLSRSLTDRGHTIIYLGLARFREYVEQQGFAFHTFNALDFGPQEKLRYGIWGRFRQYRLMMRQRLMNRDYIYYCAEQWLDEILPDLVLLDSNLLKYSVPFFKKRIPIINLTITLSSFYLSRRPPVFSGLFPARGPDILLNLRIRSAWLKILLSQNLRDFREKMGFRVGFGPGKFQTTATKVRKLGGVMKRSEYDLRLVVPEIVLGPKCIDFPVRDGERKRYYAGACVDESRKEVDFDYTCLDERKPLIYCAMGTASNNYSHATRLCRCLFAAMRQLPMYQLVLQTEGLGKIEDYSPIPENVRIFIRAPQLELLKRATLFITHGGFSSIREGIFFGVPMIVFPGWHDQPGNAARVVYYGLGERGNMRKITTSLLMAMIKNVLTDTRIRASVRNMQKKLIENDELTGSVEFIEDFIEGRYRPVLCVKPEGVM